MKTEVGAEWIGAWIDRANLTVVNLRTLRAPIASPIAREAFHVAKDLERQLLNADPPHEAEVYIQEVNRIADAYRELIGS